jgi:hypothetical protein
MGMKKLVVTLALGAAMISIPALAQDGGRGGGFMQRDQTRDQAKQMSGMMFQQLDGNKDGTLTKAEAQAAAEAFAAARGDDNGGGRMARMVDRLFGAAQSLTLQQVEAQSLARFDRMDLNHDGTVTAAERQQVRSQRQPARETPAAQTAPAKPQ